MPPTLIVDDRQRQVKAFVALVAASVVVPGAAGPEVLRHTSTVAFRGMDRSCERVVANESGLRPMFTVRTDVCAMVGDDLLRQREAGLTAALARDRRCSGMPLWMELSGRNRRAFWDASLGRRIGTWRRRPLAAC